MGYEYGTREVRAVVGGTCDRCGAKLEANPRSGNLEDGAELHLRGWYGGAIDPFPPDLYTLLLCLTCTSLVMENYFPEGGSGFEPS